MALPTVQDVKDYLRIETTAEDVLLAQLLARAIGRIEGSVGKSLTTESVIWYDDVQSFKLYGAPKSLLLKYVPIDPDSVVITDGEGETVVSTDYIVRQDIGQIVGVPGVVFATGPYQMALTAGFGTSPKYATVWEPLINAIIIDVTAFLYQQRTPGASIEGASGTSVNYGQFVQDSETGLPTRIAREIRKLRGVVLAT